MTETKHSFKNIYIIDMNKLSRQPFVFMQNGTILPIEKQNGKPVTTAIPKLFSERFSQKMVKEYHNLSAIIGGVKARTIVEYLDVNGKPILTLYPTNDTELHTNDWSHIDNRILPEIQHTIEQRNKRIARYNLSHPK